MLVPFESLWHENVWAALPSRSSGGLLEERLIIQINYPYTHATLVLSPQLQYLQLSELEKTFAGESMWKILSHELSHGLTGSVASAQNKIV